MIFYKEFTVSDAHVEQLFGDVMLGRLATVTPEGKPRVGLYPFLRNADGVELHMPTRDAHIADLRANPACVFEVDEPLTSIPSDWMSDGLALHADVYYRYACVEGMAELTDDTEAVYVHLDRLLGRYQPGVAVKPLRETPAYAAPAGTLTVIRITTAVMNVKFKLGQFSDAAARTMIAERLSARGRPEDLRTLAVLRQIAAA